MDVGIFTMFTVREGSTQFDAFNEWFRLIRQAEDQDIDTFWIGESHFRPERAVMASPLIGASAVAARTERMKIGLAVQVLPLANPLRVAEETAIVDHISMGRLIVGVGRSSFLESYQGYNIDYRESRQRFTESLDVLLGAWCKDTFSYQGEFYNFENVRLVPKTYQIPHPPVRIAVESRTHLPWQVHSAFQFLSAIRCQSQNFNSYYPNTKTRGLKLGFMVPTTSYCKLVVTLRVQLVMRSTILKKVQCIGSASFRIISIRRQMRRHTNG